MKNSLSISTILYIADDIAATKNVWLVGDKFLKNSYHSFVALRNEASLLNKPLPYLFSQYNVSAHWVGSISTGITSPIRRILNSMVNAVNKFHHLPRMIIFSAEAILLKHLAYYEFGASKIFAKNINYLVAEAYRTIETKKEDMRSKKARICEFWRAEVDLDEDLG